MVSSVSLLTFTSSMRKNGTGDGGSKPRPTGSLPPCSCHRDAPREMGRTRDLTDVVALATWFGVSKEAMARAYVDASREVIAVLILHRGLLTRVYRNSDFPRIDVGIGQMVPSDSIASAAWPASSMSELEECDPATWLSERDAGLTELLLEPVLGHANSFAMVLLHVELSNPEDDER